MENRTFRKALHLLCSPFSLAAMMLLLVNDQLLRRLWPSWWTGKLGDFAWLFFFPFALAVLFAWLIPPRVPRQERIVGWLAFGLTGSVFTLAKTLPTFHDMTIHILEMVLGIPVVLVRDPTDLIALVFLAISWRFWERQSATVPSRAAPGWAVLSLAVLLTIANSVPDFGIGSSCSTQQQVFVGGAGYVSKDGGLSWQTPDSTDLEDYQKGCKTALRSDNRVFIDSNTEYRFTPGVAIERTGDGGKTWRREFALAVSQVSLAYHKVRARQDRYVGAIVTPGPLDAAVDPITGNVIFAMGFEGVLVRKADGQWGWVPIDGYHHIRLSLGEEVFSLLSGEILIAMGFALLCLVTLLHRLHKSLGRTILLVIYWGLWAANAIFFPPAFQEMILTDVDYPLMFAGCLYLAFLILWDVITIVQHSRGALWRLAVIGVNAALLFFMPYVLWALNILPEYYAALLSAFGLGAIVLFLGYRWTRKSCQAVKQAMPAK